MKKSVSVTYLSNVEYAELHIPNRTTYIISDCA